MSDVILNGMTFDARSIEVILSGARTWQLRSTGFSKKGGLEIIQACSDLILGRVDVIGCIGPLSKKVVEDNIDKFSLSEIEAMSLVKKVENEEIFAMILESPRRYNTPIPAEEGESYSKVS